MEFPFEQIEKEGKLIRTFNPDVDIKKMVKLPDNDFFAAGSNDGLQF